MGGAIAFFINEIITDRKMAIMIIIFVAVLVMAKKAILFQFSWLKIIVFIFPPIENINLYFSCLYFKTLFCKYEKV